MSSSEELSVFNFEKELDFATIHRTKKIILENFPNLKNFTNFALTSYPIDTYNCIAWALQDTLKSWWPIYHYWPIEIPEAETLDAFRSFFELRGFTIEELFQVEPLFESKIEKIAVFSKWEEGNLVPTHAARQLANGWWTSKLGIREWDIAHRTLRSLEGVIYGEVAFLMRRPRG